MNSLTIIGTGLEIGQLTLEAAEILRSGAKIVLHTERIGCAEWLRSNSIAFESLDELYETCADFDVHAEKAAEMIVHFAESENTVYCVYDIRDRSVSRILEKYRKAKVIAGPPMEGGLMAFASGAIRMLEASEWERYCLFANENTLIREIDTRELAAEVKLKVMDCYPEEHTVYLLSGDGSVARIPLYDMDRMKRYDHRSCLLIPSIADITKLERYGFYDLVHILEILQAPDGCPWDRVQTHRTLRPCILEEAYEIIEAIDDEDPDHLYDELGDMLMNVVMQAIIAKSHGEFDISDSLTAICKKMISRHTHIFGRDNAGNSDEVLDLWTKNKMKERGQDNYTQVLREVSKTLPALMRGEKVVQKAVSSGQYSYTPDLYRNLISECLSLKLTEESLGQMLMLICELAKSCGIDCEIALNSAIDRYIDRFEMNELKSANH